MRSDKPERSILGHGEIALRPGDGGGGDAAAVTLHGVNRETAPAGADLQHVVGGFEVELAAGGFELGVRPFGERGVGARKDRAGIRHGVVEHELVEIVAEVVVRGDVARAACLLLRLAQ